MCTKLHLSFSQVVNSKEVTTLLVSDVSKPFVLLCSYANLLKSETLFDNLRWSVWSLSCT